MKTLADPPGGGQTFPPEAELDGAAFGEFLRRARESRGLTIEQIAGETKIPRRHLAALEQGNFAAVPGGMYRRGEVRAYARAVQLDQHLALAQLERALEAARMREAATSAPHAKPLRRRLFWYALMATATAALGGAWLAGSTMRRSTGRIGDPPVVPDPPTRPEPGLAPPSAADTASSSAEPAVPAEESASPETPPPPLATDGELVVTTDPAGARVTVNGIAWGTSPVTIRHLPFGGQSIRVTKDGFAPEAHAVQLTGRQPKGTIHIALRSVP